MKPSVGRIVLYRSQSGPDYPAIVTEVLPLSEERVHLHVFLPPTGRYDYLDAERGVPRGERNEPGTWRWPERVS